MTVRNHQVSYRKVDHVAKKYVIEQFTEFQTSCSLTSYKMIDSQEFLVQQKQNCSNQHARTPSIILKHQREAKITLRSKRKSDKCISCHLYLYTRNCLHCGNDQGQVNGMKKPFAGERIKIKSGFQCKEDHALVV